MFASPCQANVSDEFVGGGVVVVRGVSSIADTIALSTTFRKTRSSFWSVTVADPGARNVFSRSIYDRGAMTLQALRNRIGSPTFSLLLRTWIEEQGGGNATSEEFEALAGRLSGQDLSGFFTAWLRMPTKPADTPANGL